MCWNTISLSRCGLTEQLERQQWLCRQFCATCAFLSFMQLSYLLCSLAMFKWVWHGGRNITYPEATLVDLPPLLWSCVRKSLLLCRQRVDGRTSAPHTSWAGSQPAKAESSFIVYSRFSVSDYNNNNCQSRLSVYVAQTWRCNSTSYTTYFGFFILCGV